MATLTVQTYNENGLSATMSAAAGGGDQFTNTGKEVLVIKNNDATSKTITITAQTTTGLAADLGIVEKANRTLAVPASGVGIIGPFPKAAFNDSSNFVQITYSAVTSVTVAVINKA